MRVHNGIITKDLRIEDANSKSFHWIEINNWRENIKETLPILPIAII